MRAVNITVHTGSTQFPIFQQFSLFVLLYAYGSKSNSTQVKVSDIVLMAISNEDILFEPEAAIKNEEVCQFPPDLSEKNLVA